MLVTNWTMRRFHIASFLVLICARLAPCMPVNRPPVTSSEGQTPPHNTTTAESTTAESTAADTRPITPATSEVSQLQQNQIPAGEQGIYFQGDIRLLPSDDPYDLYRAVFKRMAFDIEGSGSSMELNIDTLSSRLWPGGRVPYRFELHLTMEYRDLFIKAMAVWSESGCIRFEPISDIDIDITEEDYIVFTDTAGCSSYVGRIGGPQEVSIDHECRSRGHAMHELGHALGLWHEHSRWDRDKYIRIVRENIRDNAYYNFGTISEEKWNNIEDMEYDLLSIMHYKAKSFSKNGEDTIEVVINVPECALELMGQRRMLSRKDKIRTSRMYLCENNTNPPEENCQIEYNPPAPSPLPTPPPPPPPTPPPNDKLFNEDRLRLNTNTLQNESLLCSDLRCHKQSCVYNPFSEVLICEEGFDFTIRHYEPRKNQKIKNGDVVVLQSLHKASGWLQCSGQNICSISDCPDNNGANASNISECDDQRFIILSLRNTLKDGDPFTLKHEFNETYMYCNLKWCDLLPKCGEGEIEIDSENHDEVVCHSPTEFYVEKLYT